MSDRIAAGPRHGINTVVLTRAAPPNPMQPSSLATSDPTPVRCCRSRNTVPRLPAMTIRPTLGTIAGDIDPRSRSSMLSAGHSAGANTDRRAMVTGSSSVTESLMSHSPVSSAPLPLATYTFPFGPRTAPGVPQMPPFLAVGTA